MQPHDMLAKLKIDETELQTRRALFEITEEDLQRLRGLRPFAEKYTDKVIEHFYELLLGNEVTRQYFPDDTTLRRVQRLHRGYFLELFSGVCDLRYVADRLRVGHAHDRTGLPPKWYLAAYSRYLRLIQGWLFEEFADPKVAATNYASIEKLVNFDIALAIDAYVAANTETITRHQAAIRELSTPVIRVYDRVLLLPLIGAIDSLRAEQIMEAVLVQVIAEQARVIILDIAGVSVVDTRVADHLLKTTAAVRLLGAHTILTGISAQVARTIVQLGVDVSTMHTSSRLADGIELALRMVGREVSKVAPEPIGGAPAGSPFGPGGHGGHGGPTGSRS